mgnify:CR=1 FL=1
MTIEIQKRRKKIKRVYHTLLDTGFLGEESLTLNYPNILTDLYTVNNLLNETFHIIKDKTITDDEKALKLAGLRDHNGIKIIASKEDALHILVTYGDALTTLFNKLISRKKYHNEQLSTNHQIGGTKSNTEKAKKDLEDILKNIERVVLKKIEVFNSALAKDPNSLADSIGDMDKIISMDGDGASTNMYDWIFHPLWKLEHTPRWGAFFEIPIDLVDTILNNTILLVELIYPIISMVMSFVGTAGVSAAVAAVPVVGPMLAGSAWEIAVQPFLDWLIPNFLKIVAFFFNISRRDIPTAYINALDFIPFMENTVHALAGMLIKINKYIDMVYPITNSVRGYTEFTSNMALAVLKDPNVLLEADKFYIEIIRPNKRLIPIVKDLSDEILDNDALIMTVIYENIYNMVKCVREGLKTNDFSKCLSLFNIANMEKSVAAKLKVLLDK